MTGRVLMVQGTSSSAGKSLTVAALCRIYARRGLRVAPFKAQNMSNNAAVCADGGEIGRSQALQAEAAGIEPTCDMNPILLKPEADSRSQVIVRGRPWRTLAARDYFKVREELWPIVCESLATLRSQFDLVVIEGAGSPAELNLNTHEIVNMAVARHCHAPVLLVGDIERGGIFAQLLGTLWLLSASDRALVQGLVVNKFRGDRSLFDSGVTILEDRGGVPVLGVIPWLPDLDLPEEDGQPLDERAKNSPVSGQIDIAITRLPRIANFDDFDPLRTEPGVAVRYVSTVGELGHPTVIILPGTKSTVTDLAWLRATGLAERILDLHARGTTVIGICGGYQMLGERIIDLEGLESLDKETAGLGLLPLVTHFERGKETHQVQATIVDDRLCPGLAGTKLSGYEIHAGRTACSNGWLNFETHAASGMSSRSDGAMSADGRVWGSYLHGLFANDTFRRAWLNTLQPLALPLAHPTAISTTERRATALNRLADHFQSATDMERLQQIIWPEHPRSTTAFVAQSVHHKQA